ncbi:MAG: hypothetical protein QM669_05130 [Siphonobacter sp.]
MKKKSIRFFSPNEPVEEKKKESKVKEVPTISISKKGKLLLSSAILQLLDVDPADAKFKVGTEDRKRGIGSLFLVKADSDDSEAFAVAKSGRGHGIPLGSSFMKLGLDYVTYDYTYEIKPFDYEEDEISGYELTLKEKTPRLADAGEEE